MLMLRGGPATMYKYEGRTLSGGKKDLERGDMLWKGDPGDPLPDPSGLTGAPLPPAALVKLLPERVQTGSCGVRRSRFSRAP